jgi:hypothetical protein
MAALVVALFAVPGIAAEPVSGPKVAVHIIPHVSTKGVDFCAGVAESTMTACSSFVTKGQLLTPYDLFIVAAQGDSLGVSGISFGIAYSNPTASGVDIVGGTFYLCASGLQFPSANWPASGEGNVITWNTVVRCGTTLIPPDGIHGTVGGFYVYAYSDDRFIITEHTQLGNPSLKVSNCQGIERVITAPDAAGYVTFNGTAYGTGCNPCIENCDAKIPVEPTTWGEMKTRYSSQLDE